MQGKHEGDFCLQYQTTMHCHCCNCFAMLPLRQTYSLDTQRSRNICKEYELFLSTGQRLYISCEEEISGWASSVSRLTLCRYLLKNDGPRRWKDFGSASISKQAPIFNLHAPIPFKFCFVVSVTQFPKAKLASLQSFTFKQKSMTSP